jgi:hypothetical protein
MSGRVSILRNGEKITAAKGVQLFASDQLMTGANSVAKIVFADGSNFIVMQEGSIEIEDYWMEAKGRKTTLKSSLNVVRGKARFFFKPREGGVDATVKTANATMGIRGTVLFVDHPNRESTNIVVVDGSVAVRNAQKPDKEILVKSKETTSVLAEAPPESPKEAPAEMITTLVAQAQTPSDPFPDGQAPETLSLPPPKTPEAKKEEKPQGGVKLPYPEPVLREIVTPEFMVVPLGANMVSRSQARCDRASLDKLRSAAGEFDSEAVILGRELAQCPGAADEALFWLAFYHRAGGESSRAIESSRFAAQEKVPLEVFTEREIAIQNALEGRTSELQRYLRAKKEKERDLDAVLLLARTFVRLGNFAEANTLYLEYLKAPKLKANLPTQIEYGYFLILRSEFEKAENYLYALTDENMSPAAARAVARGLEIARRKIQKPSGAENNRISLSLDTHNTGQGNEIVGPRFRWDSHIALVDLYMGALKYDGDGSEEPEDTTTYDYRYFHPRIGKVFSFSSGTTLKAMVGLAQLGDYSSPSLETTAAQQFKGGYSIFGGVDRLPYGLEDLATRQEIKDKATKTTIRLGGDWGRLFAERRYLSLAMRFDQIAVKDESNELLGATLALNAPVHKGQNNRDYLFATGKVDWISGSSEKAPFYSPKNAITIGVGADYSVPFKLWRQFTFSLPAQFLMVQRSASTAPTETSDGSTNGSGSDNNSSNNPNYTKKDSGRLMAKDRQYIKSEIGFEVAPTLTINIVRDFDLFVHVTSQNLTDSATSETSWRENHIEFGINWNYGRVSAPQ